jgi:fructose-1,6-bisphosphatase/sedoheptulose 1,7-bisphosphatase-like protein
MEKSSNSVVSLCAALNQQAVSLENASATFKQRKLQAVQLMKNAGAKGIIPSGTVVGALQCCCHSACILAFMHPHAP